MDLVTRRHPEPPAVLCRPLRELCVAEEERSLADRAYGGSAGRLVAAFVRSGQLDREERAELRRLLDEMEV